MRTLRSLLPLLVLAVAACDSGGTAPDLLLSVALADARTCRDSSVVTVRVGRGSLGALDFACHDMELPRQVSAQSLPLYDRVEIFGLSGSDDELYRGTLIVSDVLTGNPAVLVSLFPYAAR